MRITDYQPRANKRNSNAKLTRVEFGRERNYQIGIALIRQMLGAGIITASDFADMDDYLLSKYQPHLGLLRKGTL